MPEFTADRRKNRDRRGAPREAASGRIEILFSNPAPVHLEAELVESSATGFRASYQARPLEPGLRVTYRNAGASGEARVIWTHLEEGLRVSGFLVLP